MDDVQLYDGWIGATDVTFLHQNPGQTTGGGALPVATVFTWVPDGLGDWAGGAGSWDRPPGTQTPLTYADSPEHTAVFAGGITGPTNVSTNAAVTMNRIEFNNSTDSYAVSGLGSVNLASTTDPSPVTPTMSVTGTHKFQATVNLLSDTTINVASGSQLVFDGAFDLGGNTLTKTGDGTVAINNKLTTGTGGGVDIQQGTVSGDGTIGGDVTNSGGTTAPGNSPGTLTVDGNYNQGSGGTLAIQIGGIQPGVEHDVLNVLGDASLAGTLDVSLIDGFTPSGGNTFKVLTAAGELTDAGLTLGGSAAASFTMSVDTTNDWIMLMTAGAGLVGDFNGNGTVDAADYTIFRDNLGGDSAVLGGNGSGEATVVVADYDLWKQNFGSSGTGSSAAVPEPTAVLLVLFGLSWVLLLKLRSRQTNFNRFSL